MLPCPRADARTDAVVEDRVEEGEHAGEEGDADNGAKGDAESAARGQAVSNARVVRDVEERHTREEAQVPFSDYLVWMWLRKD